MSLRRWHKYRAVRTEVDGVSFASKREAARYQVLKLRQMAGEIRDLKLQPEYPLHIVKLYRNGWPIEIATCGKYVADFEYIECASGEIVTEDSKGVRTDTYRLKRKLVEAIHGVTISEV